ncbi:MAG TPA: glycosyltransferase family 4 protein [Chloroflexota bacterium]
MTRTLRVAHVGTYHRDSADGTEKTVAGLVSWLPAHSVDVEVWQPRRGATEVAERDVDGVRIFELPAYEGTRGFWRGVPDETQRFVAARRRHVDCVHFHSGLVPEHVAIADQVHGPYAIAPNGAYSRANLSGRNWWFKQGWLRVRERAYIDRAALLHAVSEPEAVELHDQFPRLSVSLIHNALDVPSVPSVAPLDTGGSRWLVFLGRLAVEQKGLDVLLSGYAAFLASTGDVTTRLLLVGPDYRGGQAELERLRRALGIEDRVEFRAPLFGTDKWSMLASAFALVHPSRWDGLPFTVLEAMAARRPLLVAPGTNLGPQLEAYGAGVVVEPTTDGVARGLRRLVGMSEGQLTEMGDSGRRLVEERFTWPQAARQMADAYRALVG